MENLHQSEIVSTESQPQVTSTDRVDELCKRFGYPSEISAHLKDLVQILRPEHASSIILLGSTSRGELSYVPEGQTFKLLSDYELLAVGTYSFELKKKILQEIELWEKWLPEKSRLFHVDVAFLTERQLSRLPKHWKHFEARETGWVLYGQDLRHLIPQITLRNLDFCELNQILLWRNWHLVMQLPSKLLSSEKLDFPSYSYLIARNALDLTTWILPYEGFLIPSFSSRVNFITAYYDYLRYVQKLGLSFAERLERWLKIKLGKEQSIDLISEFSEIVEILERTRVVLNALYKQSPFSQGYSPKALGDYSPHAIAKGFFLFKQNPKLVNLKWLTRPKLALFAYGLLELLKAAQSLVFGKERSPSLFVARKIIRLLLPNTSVTATKDNHKLWFDLRRQYMEFGLLYFPFLNQKANYWCETIEK